MAKKIWYSYDDIHIVLEKLAEKIKASNIRYDAMIAIGGGGLIPARILRCFIHIPIYVVSTTYYDSEYQGVHSQEVKRLQWLDVLPEEIIGKNILIVDEVDDSRVTLEYVVNELLKENFSAIGIAVLHEKMKEKKGVIPKNMPYFSGAVLEDWWVNYPWDALDINYHNEMVKKGVQED